MNYMKMVSFNKVTDRSSIATFVYKDNEDINSLDKSFLVPVFMLLEAIFQSTGKIAREFSENKRGAYVVSFGKVNFRRPVFSYEVLKLKSSLSSYNQLNGCVYLECSVYSGEEIIVDKAYVMLKQDDNINPVYLNNEESIDKDSYMKLLDYN